MYSPKPIPDPFQGNFKKPENKQSEEPASLSVPIEAKEKTLVTSSKKQSSLSPLAALLFLDIFSKKER